MINTFDTQQIELHRIEQQIYSKKRLNCSLIYPLGAVRVKCVAYGHHGGLQQDFNHLWRTCSFYWVTFANYNCHDCCLASGRLDLRSYITPDPTPPHRLAKDTYVNMQFKWKKLSIFSLSVHIQKLKNTLARFNQNSYKGINVTKVRQWFWAS